MKYDPTKAQLADVENIINRGGKVASFQERKSWQAFKTSKRQAMIDSGFKMTDADFLQANKR